MRNLKLIEIHTLKNMTASSLNRDDSGRPKSTYFADTKRGRISSQSLKYAIRHIENPFTSEIFKERGTRTRAIHEYVLDCNELRNLSEDAYKIVYTVLNKLGTGDEKVKKEKEKDKETAFKIDESAGTEQIMYYSQEDIAELQKIVIESLKEVGTELVGKKFKTAFSKNLEKAYKTADVRPITRDIAIFGRMASTDFMANVESSVSFAHSITTHRLYEDSDYFTAVDDFADVKGAAIIKESDFNASLFYGYANIDVCQLEENFKHAESPESEVQEVLKPLLKSMILTNPKGKQNSFASHVLPSAVYVELKSKKIPVNYVNAYRTPVSSDSKETIVDKSISNLIKEVDVISDAYGEDLGLTRKLWFAPHGCPDVAPKGSEVFTNLSDLIAVVVAELK